MARDCSDVAMQDNELYAASSGVSLFNVEADVDKGDCKRLGFKGHYKLSFDNQRIILFRMDGTTCVADWTYHSIRSYGQSKQVVSMVVGTKCSTGEGNFRFWTSDSARIVELMAYHTKRLKAQELKSNEALNENENKSFNKKETKKALKAKKKLEDKAEKKEKRLAKEKLKQEKEKQKEEKLRKKEETVRTKPPLPQKDFIPAPAPAAASEELYSLPEEEYAECHQFFQARINQSQRPNDQVESKIYNMPWGAAFSIPPASLPGLHEEEGEDKDENVYASAIKPRLLADAGLTKGMGAVLVDSYEEVAPTHEVVPPVIPSKQWDGLGEDNSNNNVYDHFVHQAHPKALEAGDNVYGIESAKPNIGYTILMKR